MATATPTPKEICIEDLDLAPEDDRYMRCVALADAEPGLALDREGVVRWMSQAPVAYGLWVSADDRLMLERGADSEAICVERSGRSVVAPPGKPVVLLDQDLLRVAGRQLRVHVHGDAEQVYPPEPVLPSSLSRIARSAAAALSLGAAALAPNGVVAATGPGPGAEIEVRARPPKRAPRYRHEVCNISGFKQGKKGIEVKATCRERTRVAVGTRGYLLGKDGKPMADGAVIVSRVDGRKVVAQTELKAKVEAKLVSFRMHR